MGSPPPPPCLDVVASRVSAVSPGWSGLRGLRVLRAWGVGWVRAALIPHRVALTREGVRHTADRCWVAVLSSLGDASMSAQGRCP